MVARLGGDPRIRRIILFGSRARGDARERSDADLAIEAPGADPVAWDDMLAALDEAPTLLQLGVVRLEDAPPSNGRASNSTMPPQRSRAAVEKLERALARLEEALAEDPSSPLVLDGTIQRREFVFERAWKALRSVLADPGVETASPRSAIRAAGAAGLIDDEPGWLAPLQARSETSRTHDEARARRAGDAVRAAMPVPGPRPPGCRPNATLPGRAGPGLDGRLCPAARAELRPQRQLGIAPQAAQLLPGAREERPALHAEARASLVPGAAIDAEDRRGGRGGGIAALPGLPLFLLLLFLVPALEELLEHLEQLIDHRQPPPAARPG